MSDTRDPKRVCMTPTPPPYDEEALFDNETVTRILECEESQLTTKPPVYPLCVACSSNICVSCTALLQEMGRTVTNVLPTKQTAVPSCYEATRSLMGYNDMLNIFKRTLTLSSTTPLPESQLKYVALDELKKYPKLQKISILGHAFKLSTSSLSDMIKKGEKDTYTRRTLFPGTSSASTQLNTLESYSLLTLLNCCETYQHYLFRDDISQRAISIVSMLTQICLEIPEAKELIFPDIHSNSDILLTNVSETDTRIRITGGIVTPSQISKLESRELKNTKKEVSTHLSTLFSNCNIFSLQQSHSLALDLVNQVTIVLLHPQMNREVVVACLDFLSTLNLSNPGNGPECIRKVVADNQLNAIFDLDNLDHNVVYAVVRFYNTLPLSTYFTREISEQLFQRFIYFIRKYHKPDSLLLSIKSNLLYFLSKTVAVHKQSLIGAFIAHISGLSQKFLRYYSHSDERNSWADHNEILIQVRLLYLFLVREYPNYFTSRQKRERTHALHKINGIRDMFAKLKGTLDLLNADLACLQFCVQVNH